jgi:hypothetical protein
VHEDGYPPIVCHFAFEKIIIITVSSILHAAELLGPNVLAIFDGIIAKPNNSIYVSTTNIVVDSEGHQGSPLIFSDQSLLISKNLTSFNFNFSQIQVLQCSKSLVAQSGTIDTQSNILTDGSLYPNLHKNHSTWVAAADMDFSSRDSTLMGSDLV